MDCPDFVGSWGYNFIGNWICYIQIRDHFITFKLLNVPGDVNRW